jgi:hypothetical protein
MDTVIVTASMSRLNVFVGIGSDSVGSSDVTGFLGL